MLFLQTKRTKKAGIVGKYGMWVSFSSSQYFFSVFTLQKELVLLLLLLLLRSLIVKVCLCVEFVITITCELK